MLPGVWHFSLGLNVAQASVKIALSILLVRQLGLVGVAIGTIAPMLVTNGVLLPMHVLRSFGITWREHLRDGVGRPLLTGASAFVLGIGIVSFHAPASWPPFLAGSAAFLAAAAACVFTMGLGRRIVLS